MDKYEVKTVIRALDIHPVEKKDVKVDIEVQGVARALDQGDRPVCVVLLAGGPGFSQLVGHPGER